MILEQYAKEKYPDIESEQFTNALRRAAFLSGCELMREAMEWANQEGWSKHIGLDLWSKSFSSEYCAPVTFYELITLYLAQRGEKKEKGCAGA